MGCVGIGGIGTVVWDGSVKEIYGFVLFSFFV